jgi:glycogen operon protein
VHDGFTLADLVSYENKHNEANGEENRDGSDDNQSLNCGVEGPSDDPNILALRRQLRRNQLATLFLAIGVPLLLAGDEAGNSQNGNNNAYCQDDEIGWVKWAGGDDDMTALVSELTRLRARFPQLKPHRWLEGKKADGSYDVKWLRPDGNEMGEEDWNFPEGRFVAYVLAAAPGSEGPLYIVLNGADTPVEITGPQWPDVGQWQRLLDTSNGAEPATLAVGAKWNSPPRSVLAFFGKS